MKARANKTPNEDLMNEALKHYEEAAFAIHHWNSDIPKAIRAYYEVVPEEKYEPYFGWCDVQKCKNEGVCGGMGWRETGYWTLCSKHSAMAREGKKQPKMNQSAINRESKRDRITGYLNKVI